MELNKDKFKIEGYSELDSEVITRPAIGYWADAWRRLKKNKVAMVSLFLIIVIGIMCIIGPMISPHDYESKSKFLDRTPFGSYWFGTDNLGRDLFSRVWKGGRVSLTIGIVGTIVEILIGVAYGGISGYFGGKVDDIMMRFVEVLISIPYLIIVILLLVVMPAGVPTIIIALCITGWASIARLVRGQVMQLKQSEYVLAAVALGASPIRIIAKHLIPNTIGVILVYVSMDIPNFIFSEAFLSFLGLGVASPNTSWGALIYAGQSKFKFYPHELLFPAVILCITVLAFNLLGDGLRDALDPKLRK